MTNATLGRIVATMVVSAEYGVLYLLIYGFLWWVAPDFVYSLDFFSMWVGNVTILVTFGKDIFK